MVRYKSGPVVEMRKRLSSRLKLLYERSPYTSVEKFAIEAMGVGRRGMDWLWGVTLPPTPALVELARNLGVSIDWLLLMSDDDLTMIDAMGRDMDMMEMDLAKYEDAYGPVPNPDHES